MAAADHDIYLQVGDTHKVLHMKSILLPPTVEYTTKAVKNEHTTAQCCFLRLLCWLHEGAVKQDFIH